jgi:TnpA family transposase
VNHDSAIDILAHHTDGGGLSDHVFAIMYLLGMATIHIPAAAADGCAHREWRVLRHFRGGTTSIAAQPANG